MPILQTSRTRATSPRHTMSDSTAPNTGAGRSPRVHPTVRLGYVMRAPIYPFFFALFAIHLWSRGVPAWIWAVLFAHQWIWPHLAYRVASRSADSKQAERRNLLTDAFVIGCYLPIAGFSLWPNTAAFLGIHAGNISVELLHETLAELEPQAESREVRFVTALADAAPLPTDKSRLKQIMLNLLSNAVKFTERGTVTVRLVVDSATRLPSRIEVKDTGIGIAADRLDSVFEAFQQEDDTTARRYGGTGLGLTITRSLAQAMGWQIEVQSTVGEGSTFTVVIPGLSVASDRAA